MSSSDAFYAAAGDVIAYQLTICPLLIRSNVSARDLQPAVARLIELLRHCGVCQMLLVADLN